MTEFARKFIEMAMPNTRPSGNTDKGGRWYPSENEKMPCCDNIRLPSRTYPWSLYKHCLSKKHAREKLKAIIAKYQINIEKITEKDLPLLLNAEEKHIVQAAKMFLS